MNLSELTTFRVGGPARYFFTLSDGTQLGEISSLIKEKGGNFFILGGGSNVLFPDDGFCGLVIKNELKGIEYQDLGSNVRVIAASGEHWDELVAETVERELYGLENLSGIPGTVGGAPIQNIGAYGCDVSRTIEWVEVYDLELKEFRKLSNEDCKFAYRWSLFKESNNSHLLITKVAFLLSKEGELVTVYKDVEQLLNEYQLEKPDIHDLRKIILKIRSSKFPDLSLCGTAGSFFKNPIITNEKYDELKKTYLELPHYIVSSTHVKIPIAWFIDRFGWKGKRSGNVKTFHNQALVIVADTGASADEIVSFANRIASDIKEKINITIVPEVTIATNNY